MRQRKNAQLYFIICLAALLTLRSSAAFAQGSRSRLAYLRISVSRKNNIIVRLHTDKSILRDEGLTKAIRQTFPGELLRGLQTYTKSNPDYNDEPDDTTANFEWKSAGLQTGLFRSAELDLSPLRKALKQRGIGTLDVTVDLPAKGSPFVENAQEARGPRNQISYVTTLATDAKTSAIIRFGYGYRAEDIKRGVAILGAVFLLPIVAAFLLRHRALNAKNANPTAVWFGFTQATGWIQTAFWPVWVGFLIWTRASDMLDYALGASSAGIASPGWIFLLFVPSGLVAVVIAAISQPVYSRVRGIEMTAGSLAKRTAWQQAANYLPINFTWYAFFSLSTAPQQAVFWFGASYLVRMVAANQLAKLDKLRPLALRDGELHHYVFGLAQYAGVKLKNLILLPAKQMQEANAFASAGNNILITDYLLQNMTKREVNAIMAHEMTHLRHKHANAHQIIRGICFYAPVFTLLIARAIFPNTGLDLPFWYPLAALCGLPVYTWFSRRDEKTADLGAAQMTGDPEAMISGLARLSKLSMYPQEWGRVTSGLTSHPSNARRAQYIAEAWRIPASRVKELLESPPDGERYATVEFEDETPRIYSAAWRQAQSRRTLLLYLGALALPLLAAGIVDQYGAAPSALVLPIYLLAVALSCALVIVMERWAAMRGYRRLRPALLEKLQPRLAPNAEAVLTGFAPGGLPKSYGGNRDWDLGFLQITPNELRYVGERTEFTLRRGDVVETQLVIAQTGWSPLRRLAVAWRVSEEYASGAFNILPCESPSHAETKRATAALSARLEQWQQEADSETPTENAASTPALGLPFTGKVNGTNLKMNGSQGSLILMMGILMLPVAVSAALCGLRFNLNWRVEGFGTGIYVTLCAALVAIFAWIPSARYREPIVPQTPPVPPRPPEPAPAPPQNAAPSVPPLPVKQSEFDFSTN